VLFGLSMSYNKSCAHIHSLYSAYCASKPHKHNKMLYYDEFEIKKCSLLVTISYSNSF